MVTMSKTYNYETSMEMVEYILWMFNLSAIMYEFYQGLSSPSEYFAEITNLNEFVKAVVWLLLLWLKFMAPADNYEGTDEQYIKVSSGDPFLVDCGFDIEVSEFASDGGNFTDFKVNCTQNITRQDPLDVSGELNRNQMQVC